MKVYLEQSRGDGPIGFLGEGMEFIFTGTQVHQESRVYGDLVEQLGREQGIWFWLEGEDVPIPFYAVPMLCLMARDGEGGYLARRVDDRWVWITRDRECRLLPEFDRITELPENWRALAEPVEDIRLYASRAEAEQEIRIWDVPQWEEIPDWLRELEGAQ